MKKDSEGVKKRGREISRKRRPLDPLNADRARGGREERKRMGRSRRSRTNANFGCHPLRRTLPEVKWMSFLLKADLLPAQHSISHLRHLWWSFQLYLPQAVQSLFSFGYTVGHPKSEIWNGSGYHFPYIYQISDGSCSSIEPADGDLAFATRQTA